MSRKHRRGRPRKAGARRRATTTAGRRPPADYRSLESIPRKARAGNGVAPPVELVDVAGVLFAHELIDPGELATLWQLAGWLHQLALACGLKSAGVGGLWGALLSGQRGGRSWLAPDARRSGGDVAARRLAELHEFFGRLGQLEGLALIMAVAAGERRPGDRAELFELRGGLQVIAEMQRRGRPLPVP